MGLGGIEPPTSALSVLRSNRLSYSPALRACQITRRVARPPLEPYRSESTTSKRMPPTRSEMRL